MSPALRIEDCCWTRLHPVEFSTAGIFDAEFAGRQNPEVLSTSPKPNVCQVGGSWSATGWLPDCSVLGRAWSGAYGKQSAFSLLVVRKRMSYQISCWEVHAASSGFRLQCQRLGFGFFAVLSFVVHINPANQFLCCSLGPALSNRPTHCPFSR